MNWTGQEKAEINAEIQIKIIKAEFVRREERSSKSKILYRVDALNRYYK